MLEAAQRQRAPIVALMVVFLGGGIGVAQGSSHPSPPLATKATGKKTHVLSVDYKSGRRGIDNTTPTTTQLDDQGRIAGRPFGGKRVEVDELIVDTYNSPNCIPFCSGTEHTTFKIDAFPRGKVRGFYDFSFGSDGNPSTPITGSITGGSGTFRGAKGSFQVVNRVAVHIGDTTGYTAHWQGSIRY
jgi:hypothetical protein